jgi:hypothetical protein
VVLVSASEEQVASALIASMNTALASYGATAGAVKALDLDDAIGVSGEHVQVTVNRRYTPVERGGREAQEPWRLTTRPVANTVSNGREMARLVSLAVMGQRVTVDSSTSTPIRLESADGIGEDNGKFSGLTTWTFVL